MSIRALQGETRAARAAKNQSLFRDVNERVEALNESTNMVRPLQEFVCECADESCVEPIAMTVLEYEAVRRNGKKFAVAPFDPHVFLDIERVVRKQEGFWIVEKFDESGRVAAELNPRLGHVEGMSSDGGSTRSL